MITYFEKRHNSLSYRILSAFIAFTFIFSLVLPPGYAQLIPQTLLNLPMPGTMVPLTNGFTPTLMTGVTIHPENPLRFDFVMDRGQSDLSGEPLKEEYRKMIKYFMASLTVPEDELWVNLSPYEKDRMVPQGLGDTEMGRDMLAQDYLLKQLTASLMYPEKELGKEFWNKVYKEAKEKFGTTEIPVNTFNKVWIVPDGALVYEQGSSAFVIKSRLKVMLEHDYEDMSHNVTTSQSHKTNMGDVVTGDLVTPQVVREVILPAIEVEVNEGKNFANLRQIYNTLILATWYKERLKDSLLGKVYVNQNKTKGIDTWDKEVNRKIYDQYIESFKKGVYNFIKEDIDPATQEIIPRKYFSGGMAWKLGGLKTLGAFALGTLLSFGSPDVGNASALAAAAMGGNNKNVVVTEFVDNAKEGDIGTAIVVKEGVPPILLAQAGITNDEGRAMNDEKASSPVVDLNKKSLEELQYGEKRFIELAEEVNRDIAELKGRIEEAKDTNYFEWRKNKISPELKRAEEHLLAINDELKHVQEAIRKKGGEEIAPDSASSPVNKVIFTSEEFWQFAEDNWTGADIPALIELRRSNSKESEWIRMVVTDLRGRIMESAVVVGLEEMHLRGRYQLKGIPLSKIARLVRMEWHSLAEFSEVVRGKYIEKGDTLVVHTRQGLHITGQFSEITDKELWLFAGKVKMNIAGNNILVIEPASSPVVVTKQDVHTWRGFDDLELEKAIEITVKSTEKDVKKRVPAVEVGHIKKTRPSQSMHRLKQEVTDDVYIVELKSGTDNNLLFNIGSNTDGLSWISVFQSDDGENYKSVGNKDEKPPSINVTEAMKALTFRVFDGEKRIEVIVSKEWFDFWKGINKRKLIADAGLETLNGYRFEFIAASSPVKDLSQEEFERDLAIELLDKAYGKAVRAKDQKAQDTLWYAKGQLEKEPEFYFIFGSDLLYRLATSQAQEFLRKAYEERYGTSSSPVEEAVDRLIRALKPLNDRFQQELEQLDADFSRKRLSQLGALINQMTSVLKGSFKSYGRDDELAIAHIIQDALGDQLQGIVSGLGWLEKKMDREDLPGLKEGFEDYQEQFRSLGLIVERGELRNIDYYYMTLGPRFGNLDKLPPASSPIEPQDVFGLIEGINRLGAPYGIGQVTEEREGRIYLADLENENEWSYRHLYRNVIFFLNFSVANSQSPDVRQAARNILDGVGVSKKLAVRPAGKGMEEPASSPVEELAKLDILTDMIRMVGGGGLTEIHKYKLLNTKMSPNDLFVYTGERGRLNSTIAQTILEDIAGERFDTPKVERIAQGEKVFLIARDGLVYRGYFYDRLNWEKSRIAKNVGPLILQHMVNIVEMSDKDDTPLHHPDEVVMWSGDSWQQMLIAEGIAEERGLGDFRRHEANGRYYLLVNARDKESVLQRLRTKVRFRVSSSPVTAVLSRVNPTTTARWPKLKELAAEKTRYDLRKLFDADPERAKRLSVALDDEFKVDFSKNLIDDETLSAWLGLADETKLKEAIEQMFTGEKINETENRAVLHTALRNVTRDSNGEIVAANGPVYVDGKDVMPGVIKVLNQMKEFTNKVRSGEWKGATGKTIKHVVNVGIGGSDLGPKMAAEALKPFGRGSGITAHFVSNVDGTAVAELIRELGNPEETLIVIESKTFTTQETIQNALTLKEWVNDYYKEKGGVRSEDAIKKHFVAVSTAKELVEAFGIDPENMFAFWDWVGGRYSMWSAIGLTLATFIGFDNFFEMLEGAREMDEHFRSQPFDKNIPVLKALLGVWNRNFLNAETYAILPYDEYASLLPAFLQQGFMESQGKGTDRGGNFITGYHTGQILFGAAGTDGQHSFYQLIHQSPSIVPADFIGIARTQNPVPGHHEKLYSNFVAQPYALAFGSKLEEVMEALNDGKMSPEELRWLAAHRTFPGNKPTTSIFIDEMRPRALGKLIAMYEHQIMAEGIVYNIFSFDQWGVQLGKVVATKNVLDFLNGTRPMDELGSVPYGNTIKDVVEGFVKKQPASSPVSFRGISQKAGEKLFDMMPLTEEERSKIEAVAIETGRGVLHERQAILFGGGQMKLYLTPEAVRAMEDAVRTGSGTENTVRQDFDRLYDETKDTGDILNEARMGGEGLGVSSSPAKEVGGIDLNPALLDLQIKRDGNGAPLPLLQQPIENMHIEGFLPIIINVTPLTNLPLLLGLADTEQDADEITPAMKAREPEEISALN